MKDSIVGFTLIELLVVIAIIGILSAVLIPYLLNARRAANDSAAQSLARSAVTLSEIKRAKGDSLITPAQDCDATLSSSTNSGLGMDYGTSVTECKVLQDANTTYVYTKSYTGSYVKFDGSVLRRMTSVTPNLP